MFANQLTAHDRLRTRTCTGTTRPARLDSSETTSCFAITTFSNYHADRGERRICLLLFGVVLGFSTLLLLFKDERRSKLLFSMEAICRLCLCDIAPPNNLFSQSYREYFDITVDFLLFSVNINFSELNAINYDLYPILQLPENDHWPKGVCSGCLKTLIDFSRFKQQVLSKQSLLPEKYPAKESEELKLEVEPEEEAVDDSSYREEQPSSPKRQRKPRTLKETLPINTDALANDDLIEEIGQDTSLTDSDDQTVDKPSHKMNQKNGLSKCLKCGKYYKRLHQHMKIHEFSGEPFPCDQCEKKFDTKIRLMNHMVCVHSRDRDRYKCSTCGKGFLKKGTLKVRNIRH